MAVRRLAPAPPPPEELPPAPVEVPIPDPVPEPPAPPTPITVPGQEAQVEEEAVPALEGPIVTPFTSDGNEAPPPEEEHPDTVEVIAKAKGYWNGERVIGARFSVPWAYRNGSWYVLAGDGIPVPTPIPGPYEPSSLSEMSKLMDGGKLGGQDI